MPGFARSVPGSSRAARLIAAAALLSALYIASYVLYRRAHTEVWGRDGRPYVVFPERHRALYYFYRPAAYLDGAATGIGFHLGPHR